MKENTPAAAVMRIFAFTTLAVNRKLPTRVSTYWACKYTETKRPWLLAKIVWEHIFKTLLNVIGVWLTALCLSLLTRHLSFSYSSLCFPCFLPSNLLQQTPQLILSHMQYLCLVLLCSNDLIKLIGGQLQ